MEKENIYYLRDDGKLGRTDKRAIYEQFIDKYNICISEGEADGYGIDYAIQNIIINFASDEKYTSNEFIQTMVILMFVEEGRDNSRWIWGQNAHVSFRHGDLEICRESVILDIKKCGASDVRNSNRQYPALSKETKDENVADILGLIVEELEHEGHLEEDKYKELLNCFAKLLNKWRSLEVPKVKYEKSYDLIYEIIQLCCSHKAYHTALRLSGLLFVADQTNKKEKLADSIFLSGKILYELGYMEQAKRCFIFADKDTDKKCWQGEEEKYHDLLNQETKLEMNEELLNKLQMLEDMIKSGNIKTYTEEEHEEFYNQYFHKTLKLEPSEDPKKRQKLRKKLGEKAVAKYEKYAQGSCEERLKGIEEAFAVFKEEPEVYEAAAYLYYLKANCYLSQNDFEKSYECFKKAYRCESGKGNGLILLGIAIVLSQMGRMKESAMYVFRTYILCGKNFIIEKCGDVPWKMIEKYLK